MTDARNIVSANTIYSDNFKLDYLTGGWVVVDRDKMIGELKTAITDAYRDGLIDGQIKGNEEGKRNEKARVLKFIEDGYASMIYTSEAGSKIIFLDCIEGMIEELRGEP